MYMEYKFIVRLSYFTAKWGLNNSFIQIQLEQEC